MAGSTSLGLPSIIDALLRILSSLGSPSRGADRNHPSRLSPIPFKVGGWGGRMSPGLSDTQKTIEQH